MSQINIPELLVPGGSINSIRAAITYGANAIYLGVQQFNARMSAGNISLDTVTSIIKHCHNHNVKVYITMNILIKNSELHEYLTTAAYVAKAGADAIIVQDAFLVEQLLPLVGKTEIHLSTQATTTNTYAVPEGVKRVILPRELPLTAIQKFTQKYETEVFVHGALCFSYSGQCLLSAMAGGRSGNRGRCAQPCRMKYNNKFPISTMDLCAIEQLPALIKSGVASLKIEGRLRSATYVATVTRIYRKYLDMIKEGKEYVVDQKDISALKLAFNREFTQGFAFTQSIVDNRGSGNRGLFLGIVRDKKLQIRESLEIGDGIGFVLDEERSGHALTEIKIDGKSVDTAEAKSIIDINMPNGTQAFKTSAKELQVEYGDEIQVECIQLGKLSQHIPLTKQIAQLVTETVQQKQSYPFHLHARAHSVEETAALVKTDVKTIYLDPNAIWFIDAYNVIRDFEAQRGKHVDLFLYTQPLLLDEDVEKIIETIKKYSPDGIMIGDRGLLYRIKELMSKQIISKSLKIHTLYSIPLLNDIDMIALQDTLPMISAELQYDEMKELTSRDFMIFCHGEIPVMRTREKLKAPELVDNEQRHFQVKVLDHHTEILNSAPLGLFNQVKRFQAIGVKDYYIDTKMESAKFVRIYAAILSGKPFDDIKIRKGYTTGLYFRGVM